MKRPEWWSLFAGWCTVFGLGALAGIGAATYARAHLDAIDALDSASAWQTSSVSDGVAEAEVTYRGEIGALEIRRWTPDGQLSTGFRLIPRPSTPATTPRRTTTPTPTSTPLRMPSLPACPFANPCEWRGRLNPRAKGTILHPPRPTPTPCYCQSAANQAPASRVSL